MLVLVMLVLCVNILILLQGASVVKGEYFTQISVNMFSVVLSNTVYSMNINKHQALMKKC